jgi:Putative metallopeptidase
MIRFASIAVLATIAASPVPSLAQGLPLPPNPNIIVDYIEPRAPDDPQDKNYAKDMAAYQREMKIYQRLKQRQVLEELSAFLSPLKLPKTLRVRTKSCGVVNAFYEPNEWTVNMCYEWIDATEQMAPQTTSPEGFTRQEVIVGGFVGVILHELGHAVSDMYQLPVLGREEDSADQISGFVMQQFGKDVARTAIKGMAYVWLTYARQGSPAYWDVHSTPGQRFYNFLCIGYGGDPATFQDQVDKWLSKDRVASCPHEYQQVKNAFVKTILPHVDQELMKKVQAAKWLRPDDGKWD